MNLFINYLFENDILGAKGPNVNHIGSLSISDFVEMSIDLNNIVKKGYKPISNPLYTHAASLSLGGGAIECAAINCRIERIHSLARFTLMYSDKVFIDNFFDGYSELDSSADLEWAKTNFIEDLLVLNEIRPLIENGYIEFFSPNKDMCFTCHAKQFLGDEAASNFDKLYKKLKTDFLQKMSVEAYLENGEIVFDLDGPPPYFDHPKCSTINHIPDALHKRPTILKKLIKGKTIQISRILIEDLKLNSHLAHPVVTNSIYGLASSSCLNTSFLTENDLHIDLLNSLQSNHEISRRNLIAEKYLSTIVPFLEDVQLKNLIRLRNREYESFLLFRQALNKSLDEFHSLDKAFTENDAQSIYSDLIEPSLAQLDLKVKNAKKDLISKPFRSLVGIVGVLSFGLLAGLVPSNISEIVKALGLLKFGSDFVKDSMAIGDQEKKIRSDHFYFLWKIKKMGK